MSIDYIIIESRYRNQITSNNSHTELDIEKCNIKFRRVPRKNGKRSNNEKMEKPEAKQEKTNINKGHREV